LSQSVALRLSGAWLPPGPAPRLAEGPAQCPGPGTECGSSGRHYVVISSEVGTATESTDPGQPARSGAAAAVAAAGWGLGRDLFCGHHDHHDGFPNYERRPQTNNTASSQTNKTTNISPLHSKPRDWQILLLFKFKCRPRRRPGPNQFSV